MTILDDGHNSSWWPRNTYFIGTVTVVALGALAGIVYYRNKSVSKKSKVAFL